MKIAVLGAVGSMAIECTRDLVKTVEFDEAILADQNIDLLQKLAEEMNDSRITIVQLDASNQNQLENIMDGCDLFINGMPSQFSPGVLDVAIKLRISGIDITGLVNMFDYDQRAKDAGIIVVAGVGCTPGITNVLAKYGSDRLDEVDTITISFAAWRPIAMSPGLVDFTIWALSPTTPERCYYEGGKFIPAPPFSEAREIDFMDPIGKQRVYCLPHQGTITIPKYIKCRKMVTLGTYPVDDMELFRYLSKYGFMEETPRADGVVPLEFVRSHLKIVPEAREVDFWHYALVVEVEGWKDNKKLTHCLAASHPSMDSWGGQSVYAKFTGIPLSVGSQMLAKGKIKGMGILAPETCIPPKGFINCLKERGLIFDFVEKELN
ncbi:MAG: saccharopine dehydrogenase C-terminal domain-containing protein [Dehalobacterium sp.]